MFSENKEGKNQPKMLIILMNTFCGDLVEGTVLRNLFIVFLLPTMLLVDPQDLHSQAK
jgi:hypothetical protein